jgi:xanthine dehydrogenase YagR molybdenum-binding subunit
MKTGIGTSLPRVDGLLKVTGQARYAAEHACDNLLYGVAVSSSIAKGRIASIDCTDACALAGVIDVITHQNRPRVALRDRSYQDESGPDGSPFRPLYDDKIAFSGQPVALVVAETFEAARHAATLVAIEYEAEQHNTDLRNALTERFLPKAERDSAPENRGNVGDAMAKSPIRTSAEYHLPSEHHNPMEMHATTVVWDEDGRITVYDKTQGPQNVRDYIVSVFGFRAKNVRVLNPFVGGAFGSGLRPQYQAYLAVLAAKMLKRSIRVVLTRQQMFTHVHRPECRQLVSLAADREGRLSAIINTATTATSRYENHTETIVDWGGMAYACPNAEFDYAIAATDIPTPGDMRAPGAATGMNLFEIAIDELAYAADVDPLELRIRNYSDKDELQDKPYTSKALMAAYRIGAERFGWSKRQPQPRSMTDGNELVGWGVATGIWEALLRPASARATLSANGHLDVASASSDIGPGTYTMMTQIAGETLGVPVEHITVQLGDSDLPKAPVQCGSFTAASVGAAVQLACRSLGEKLFEAAREQNGKIPRDATIDQMDFVDGVMRMKNDSTRSVSLSEIMRAAGEQSISTEDTLKPKTSKRARNCHSAVFAEVKVDAELGVVRITRLVCAVAAGRIINPMLARSQVIGGAIMGIGMALHEESVMDHRLGRFMTHNLADYHIPVHADAPDIEVIFVDEPDHEVSPLGVKGVGEIGVVGTAAAIANALYHATGKRVRDLPITIDKLLDRGH